MNIKYRMIGKYIFSINIETMLKVGVSTQVKEFENSSEYWRHTHIDLLIFQIRITSKVKDSEKYWY